MGVSTTDDLPAPGTGPPPSNPAYPPSEHGSDIYRAPSPYRSAPVGAPEQAISSRSTDPSPNPMRGPGPGVDGSSEQRRAGKGGRSRRQPDTHELRRPLLTRLACRS